MLFGMRFLPAENSLGTAGKYFRQGRGGPGSSGEGTGHGGNSGGNSGSNDNSGNGGQNSRGSRGQGYGGRDPGGRNGGNRDGRGARQTNRSDSRFGGNRNRNGSGQRQAQRSAQISNAASQRAAAERAAAQAQEQKQSRFAISQQNRAKQIGIAVTPGRQIAPGLDTQPSSPGYKQSAQDSFEGLAVGERSRRNTQAAEYASATPGQKKSFRNNALAGIGSLAGFAIGGPVGLGLALGSAALGAFGTGDHSRGGLATAAGLASPVPGVGTAIRASGISKDISDNAAILGRSKSVGRHNTNLDADRAEAKALGARASVGRQSNQDAVNAATSYGSVGRQSDQAALRAATSFASTGRQSNRAVNDTALSNASTGRQSNRAVNDAALSNASVGRQSNRAVQDAGLSYGSRGRHNASTDVGLQSIANAFTGATPDSVGPATSPSSRFSTSKTKTSTVSNAFDNNIDPYTGEDISEANAAYGLQAAELASVVSGVGLVGQLARTGAKSLGKVAGSALAAGQSQLGKSIAAKEAGKTASRVGYRSASIGTALGGIGAEVSNIGLGAVGRFAGRKGTQIAGGALIGGKKAASVIGAKTAKGVAVGGTGAGVGKTEAQGNLGAGIGNLTGSPTTSTTSTPSVSSPKSKTGSPVSSTPGGAVGASPGSPAPATPGSPQLSSPSAPPSVVAPGTPTSPAPSAPSAPSTPSTPAANAQNKPGPNGGILSVDGSGNIIEILPNGEQVPIQTRRIVRRSEQAPVQNYTNQYYRRHAGGVLGIQPQRRPKA